MTLRSLPGYDSDQGNGDRVGMQGVSYLSRHNIYGMCKNSVRLACVLNTFSMHVQCTRNAPKKAILRSKRT